MANVAGAVFVFVYLAYLSDSIGGEDDESEARALVLFVAYLATALVVGLFRVLGHVRPIRRWLDDGRRATPAERDQALRLPFLLARAGFVGWTSAAVLFASSSAVVGEPALELLRIGLGILLGGISTTALTYLLVERGLRPVFARALETGVPRHTHTVGIRPRLVLSWALGSGIPLLGIALSPIGRRSVLDLAVLAFVGIAAGGLMTALATRSVADRLRVVRSALARVEAGDVDVVIPVDEGGEVGMLQSGFNAMVAGLRERQRLRDLFGRHVGDEVARQALQRGAGLGGEQREVSALFVDLIASTAMAARRPAEDVVATLNALFEAVVDCAAAEGGWVNKFEGDGAMCVFGAPGDQPDHAARALRTARALRRRLVELGVRHPDLDAGIGVSSGPAVAGNVGTEARYEYTVVGDPVNEAARLTELAKTTPARVLASGASIARAGEEAEHWRGGVAVVLRGRPGPSTVWEPMDGDGRQLRQRVATAKSSPSS
jgi:adenylate cyclase